MPPNLTDYIKLSEVPEIFKVSVTTLRRRRDQARRGQGEPEILAHFIVKTRDGEIFEQPSREKVNDLTRSGKMPEWLVNHHWLRQEFGPLSPLPVTTAEHDQGQGNEQPATTPNEHPDQPVNTIKTILDTASDDTTALKIALAQIDDLQTRLDASETRYRELLSYAQTDKELFAKANESLTRLLPALTPKRTQQGTEPRPSPPTKTNKKKTKSRRRGILGWLR